MHPQPPAGRLASRSRGSAMIVILVVVAIILIVMVLGPFAKTTDKNSGIKHETTQAVESIERAGAVACLTNRQMIQTELVGIQINNGGTMPPMDQVRNKLEQYKCPRGGAIVIGKDGKVYCTKHDPPPIEELQNMVTLFDEKPAETPLPPPPVVTPLH